MIIKLNSVFNKPMWINPDHITFMSREELPKAEISDLGYRYFTLVATSDGHACQVTDKPEEIVALIK